MFFIIIICLKKQEVKTKTRNEQWTYVEQSDNEDEKYWEGDWQVGMKLDMGSHWLKHGKQNFKLPGRTSKNKTNTLKHSSTGGVGWQGMQAVLFFLFCGIEFKLKFMYKISK